MRDHSFLNCSENWLKLVPEKTCLLMGTLLSPLAKERMLDCKYVYIIWLLYIIWQFLFCVYFCWGGGGRRACVCTQACICFTACVCVCENLFWLGFLARFSSYWTVGVESVAIRQSWWIVAAWIVLFCYSSAWVNEAVQPQEHFPQKSHQSLFIVVQTSLQVLPVTDP